MWAGDGRQDVHQHRRDRRARHRRRGDLRAVLRGDHHHSRGRDGRRVAAGAPRPRNPTGAESSSDRGVSSCSSGASTSCSASRSSSSISRSTARADEVFVLVGVVADVVAVVLIDARRPGPEGERVAGLERLSDHRHVAAGHEVEARPLVGWSEQVREAVHRHRRPAVRPHRQREVVADRGARVLPRAVGDLHPVPVDPADRPFANGGGRSRQQRHERPAVRAVIGRDAEDVGDRREEVDARRQRIARRAAGARPASGRGAACGRGSRTASRPASPRCPSRRGSGRDRCTR